MAFVGQLGLPESKPGNIELGIISSVSQITATIDGTSTTNLSALFGSGTLGSTVNNAGDLTALLVASGAITGTANGSSTVSPALTATGNITSTIDGQSTIAAII